MKRGPRADRIGESCQSSTRTDIGSRVESPHERCGNSALQPLGLQSFFLNRTCIAFTAGDSKACLIISRS